MKTQAVIRRQFVAACASAVALCGVLGVSSQAMAQTKIPMRISTPAVPDDWHAKMWTVFKENLDKSSANQFDVQINLNASLFKQGTEPAAMARESSPVLSISFQWVFLPFVLLLVALVFRSAWGIYSAIQGEGLEDQGMTV